MLSTEPALPLEMREVPDQVGDCGGDAMKLGMDLAEYVEKSLIAIAKGVREAQQKADVTIAPAKIEGKPQFSPQFVKFEVEVATSTEGGGRISVLSFGEGEASRSAHHSHRITFEVPVHFNSKNAFR